MKLNLHMSKVMSHGLLGIALFSSTLMTAQQDPIVEAIVKEATENSQLEKYAFEFIDVIGPRLVGTPELKQAHDWVVDAYKNIGVDARNEEYGTWKAWQRGATQVTMTSPRVKSLDAMQLAWSPATKKNGVEGEVTILADVKDKAAFEAWLPSVKGKYVMISVNLPTGRPDYQWKEYATPESYEKMTKAKEEAIKNWSERIKNTGYTAKELPKVLEEAGAAGVIMSYWTGIMGANRIFGAETKKVPTLDINYEDYSLLYRLAENGKAPKIHVNAQSKDLGVSKTYNTIAEFKGTQKPEEYVVLSAHIDSWDGASGATDNGTGIITMLEAVRILKQVLPNPKRTILVGNWGGEEQGLNGSRAFAEDHPEIMEKIQVVLNQDSGTGRISSLSGQGFLHSYKFLGDWLQAVPQDYKRDLKTYFPGAPSASGSDHAAFVVKDVPAFMLSSLSWGYGGYTWHTNRDTADKIVFDDIRANAILIAIMAYKASESDEVFARDRAELPLNKEGKRNEWPAPQSPKRTSN